MRGISRYWPFVLLYISVCTLLAYLALQYGFVIGAYLFMAFIVSVYVGIRKGKGYSSIFFWTVVSGGTAMLYYLFCEPEKDYLDGGWDRVEHIKSTWNSSYSVIVLFAYILSIPIGLMMITLASMVA